ncbi:hypothetical protein BGW42_006654 [Actinomortierella wolfii]|nr:hypothetical protein BGW42_006654 [Actinomortierella wolfii]
MLTTRAISLAQARAIASATSRRRMMHAPRAGPSSWRCASRIPQENYSSNLVPRRWNSSSSTFQSNRDQQQQLAPLGRAIVATTKTLKSLLLFSATTFGVGFVAWSGAHLYLEQYKCPTPQNLSTRVQSLLHGAWVREEYAMDPDVALEYYKNAIDFATEEVAQALGLRLVGYPSASQQLYNQQQPRTKWGQKALQEQLEKQAKDPQMKLLEMDASLVEVHHRRARFFDAIGQDEQAARIWDRLWRMTGAAEDATSKAATGAAEPLKRPLMVRESGVLFARRAAECWMRLGRYDEAEEALAWALESITTTATTKDSTKGSHSPEKGISVDTQSDEISLLTILGALYARKKRYDDALSLFVRALQLTRQRKEEEEEKGVANVEVEQTKTKGTSTTAPVASNPRDKWHCREAILMNSIGETLYGSVKSNAPPAAAETEKKSTDAKKQGGFGAYFWSSSSKDATTNKKEQEQEKSRAIALDDKEQEALGWMQKALSLAQEKSGKERDCDECAALVLNNLGMIYEMKGDTSFALEHFKNAVVHATTAQDFVGLESYMENVSRLQEAAASQSEPSP